MSKYNNSQNEDNETILQNVNHIVLTKEYLKKYKKIIEQDREFFNRYLSDIYMQYSMTNHYKGEENKNGKRK